MDEAPRMPGFSSTSTRRSASSAEISSPDSMRQGRTSRYFHRAGRHGVTGVFVTSVPSTSHSGARSWRPMRS